MHMSPPPGGDPFGKLMVVAGTAILLYSSFLAVRVSIRRGETEPGHPKNVMLEKDR